MFLSSKAEVFYLIFGKVTTIGFCKNARKVNSENSILRIQSKKPNINSKKLTLCSVLGKKVLGTLSFCITTELQ